MILEKYIVNSMFIPSGTVHCNKSINTALISSLLSLVSKIFLNIGNIFSCISRLSLCQDVDIAIVNMLLDLEKQISKDKYSKVLILISMSMALATNNIILCKEHIRRKQSLQKSVVDKESTTDDNL